MSAFLKWNDALAQHFFRPEMAGRSVYLYVTDEIIAEAGDRLDPEVDDFTAAVKSGAPWLTREGLCQQALQSFEQWRTRDLPYPPYVGYLCLFVLAAGVEGDFAPHAYYPRLRHLLDYEAGGTLPSFDRMLALWDDLEQWSTQDRAGELGIFEARIAGGWVHVGLPLAQTILTEHERNALVRIFSGSALDPTSPPADAELAALLRQRGTGHLRPRTLELLATRSDEDRYEVLLDTVAEELGAWDGQFEGDAGGDAPSVPRVAGALRLCLRVDPVAARVKATLRCRLKREFPEGGLLLTQPESTQEVSCIESAPGWSTPLTDDQTRDAVDAAGFDWSEGATLEDRTLGWRFRLPPRAVRIFVDGSGDGLPGLVEVHELQRSQPFHLLFASEAWEGLEAWAHTECRGYQEYEIRGGLPCGWRLASIEAAEKDSSVRNAFPILAFSERVRLTFRGGIRSSVGNTFFAFAPPELSLDGGEQDDQLWCNDRLLQPTPVGLYELPDDLPRGSPINVEVRRGGRIPRRRSLFLSSDSAWPMASPSVEFDQWGEPVANGADDETRVAGALVLSEAPDSSGFARSPLSAPGLEGVRRSIHFLGRSPGEVVEWPAEPLPTAWTPIWAIPAAKRTQAIYCGDPRSDSSPLRDGRGGRRLIRLWKELLWYRRKRIKSPAQRGLSALWREYREVARNA